MTALTPYWMALLAGLVMGLAASPHCAGMCGAFPLCLSRAAGGGRPWVRHLLYLTGKALTYIFLGALAGLFGKWAVESRLVAYSQQALAYAAGGAMLLFGLAMLGAFAWVRLPVGSASEWSFVQHLCTGLLRSPGPGGSFLLGLGTGFLPCPITLAMAAAAAASHSVPVGMAAMLGLAIGTAVVLLAVGLSGTLVDRRIHRLGLRGAAVVVIVLGAITLLRPSHLLCRFLPTLGEFDLRLPGPREVGR